MKRLSTLLLACIATSTHAQTGIYTWQVSQDGVNWQAEVTPAAVVHVRLLVSWAGVIGTDLGYAGGQFDATLAGASAASTVSNILRPSPFSFAAQTLVSSFYAGGIKIDTAADVAAPGGGTGWINPGQAAKDFAAPGTYNSNNPAVIFSFDVSGGQNNVTFGMVLNQTAGRALAVYSNSGGTQVRISASSVTVETARIWVPSPSSLALMCVSGFVAARRRR